MSRGHAYALGALAATLTALPAHARAPFPVAYAGSMGVVMDRALGPAFCRRHHCVYQGLGQGAYGLARRIAAHALATDAFLAITPGPIRLLQKAHLVTRAIPIASTQMAIAYSTAGPYRALFRRVREGLIPWYRALETPGVRFGRTDPRTDPQGRNIVFTLQLAARYYHKPGLARAILGPLINTRQIFSEPTLLARLEAGQIAASSTYLSAARSLHLSAIRLPAPINLSDPALATRWYRQARLVFEQKGVRRIVHPQPLVFYAAVPEDAPDPALGRAFLRFLISPAGQKRLRQAGYGPPLGAALTAPRAPSTRRRSP